MLEEREAFLRAIFDAPADDTPRLVYADWLEERGEEGLAGLIRAGQQVPLRSGVESTSGTDGEFWQQFRQEYGLDPINANALITGGSGDCPRINVTSAQLLDPTGFRTATATVVPAWFAARSLQLIGGRITDGRPFDLIFSAPACRRVVRLELWGVEEPIPGVVTDDSGSVVSTEYEYRIRPVISTAGVVALTQHRGAHRLRELDLTNNDLDNDAARAVARSPFLDNLTSLRMYEGNRLRGRVWQQVVERFRHVLGGDENAE